MTKYRISFDFETEADSADEAMEGLFGSGAFVPEDFTVTPLPGNDGSGYWYEIGECFTATIRGDDDAAIETLTGPFPSRADAVNAACAAIRVYRAAR